MFSFDNPVVRADLARLSPADFAPFRGARILITGVSGMLATYLAFAFLDQNDRADLGVRLVGLARTRRKAENRFRGLLERPDFSLLFQDVTEPIRDAAGFDFIFHLAGDASAAAIVSAPESIILANVLGTKNVLDLAAAHPGTRVFFASTREVYGKTDAALLREETLGVLDPCSTRSCYPESKRMAENLCAVCHDRRGVSVCIARIAHVYGPGMAVRQDGRIMSDLLGNAARGEDLVLKSDGTARRAFCYLTDAVSGILKAVGASGGFAVFNLANETEEISVGELAKLIASLCPGLRVRFEAPPADAKKAYFAAPRVRLSTEKLERLGWSPQVPLRDGIARTLRCLEP